MAYIVVHMFDDLTDFKETKAGKAYHRYEVGDEYPRAGYTPEKGRVEELSSGENRQGVPLIKKIEEKKPPAKKPARAAKTGR